MYLHYDWCLILPVLVGVVLHEATTMVCTRVDHCPATVGQTTIISHTMARCKHYTMTLVSCSCLQSGTKITHRDRIRTPGIHINLSTVLYTHLNRSSTNHCRWLGAGFAGNCGTVCWPCLHIQSHSLYHTSRTRAGRWSANTQQQIFVPCVKINKLRWN